MRNKDRRYFYGDFEDAEFFHRGLDLFRRTPEGELKFFTVRPEDNPEGRDAFICWLREYENYAVILLTWSLKRNILVFDKAANKLLYQLHDPKNVFSSRPNSWVNIYTKLEDLDEGCFVAVSVDKYYEIIRLADGTVVKEVDPRGNDPRDF